MNASEGIATKPQRRRRLWLWLPVAVLALAVLAFVAVQRSSLGQRAAVGTGYVAHVVCSCRYVGNRDLASCRTDMEPGTEIVTITDDTEKRTVTASVGPLSRRSAAFDPEYGCLLAAP